MKKLYATLFLISLGLFAQLPAQTLKNIHRHNLPVLQIPVDLIDKVETVDVDGVKNLRVTPLFGEITQIPISEIDSITHYIGSVNPEQLGEMRTASVMGVVRDTANAPIMNAIIRSPYGGEETRTDPNGVFFLNDIVVYDKLGYITISKPGFHQGSRSFLPLENGSNRVNVQLLPMTQSGSFNSASGGTVTSGLLQLNFPANAIQQNGQPYNGTVRVYAEALDPTSPDMFDQMPGELLGGMNDSLRLLRSFGMAAVELRDENMNELQLAEGASATLTFNIPEALQADAPETIDWWSFNETLGYWKHEGEAQRQGNQYIGQASHFSWWNCDVPFNFIDFNGSVHFLGGTPISDALVKVLTTNIGEGSSLTNAIGAFSGRVPVNQILTLTIYVKCETTSEWDLIYSEEFNSGYNSIVAEYELPMDNTRYPISGTILNCDGQAVESGYVKNGARIFMTDNGNFTFQTCTLGTNEFLGFDSSFSDSLLMSELISVDVGIDGVDAGNIEACSHFFGEVTDIEGNTYTTVLIGSQLWMAENLRTSRFAENSEIPYVTDNVVWSQLTTPAWCNYDNTIGYELIYGKLYNWYSVSDPRSVCPSGWHVPTDEDWNILTDFLGGSNIAGNKMKSTDYWQFGGVGSSNSSGFNGLPAGSRVNISGYFFGLGYYANWWSSTEFSLNNAWMRNLNNDADTVTRENKYKQFGFSVRCIKD